MAEPCNMVKLLGGLSMTALAASVGLTEQEVGVLALYSPGLLHRYALGYIEAAEFLEQSNVSANEAISFFL